MEVQDTDQPRSGLTPAGRLRAANMLITGIKSRPIYDTLHPLTHATHHLLAAQGSGGAALLRLLGEMPALLSRTTIFYSTESFSGQRHDRELSGAGVNDLRLFEDNETLIQALGEYLKAATMGTVIYLAGSESFIGRAMQVASAFDLKSDEVLREHCGTYARRVICIHCNGMNEDATRRIVTCAHCSLPLIVRDHYSRRLGAFMGVKADAETPGILPPDEELDT